MLTEDYASQIWLAYNFYRASRGDNEEKKKPVSILAVPVATPPSDNQPMLFSTWWPTQRVILPTPEHFPQPKSSSKKSEACGEDSKSSWVASIGPIRPVNIKQTQALLKSFEENGNRFDPAHPVSSGFFAFVLVWFATIIIVSHGV